MLGRVGLLCNRLHVGCFVMVLLGKGGSLAPDLVSWFRDGLGLAVSSVRMDEWWSGVLVAAHMLVRSVMAIKVNTGATAIRSQEAHSSRVEVQVQPRERNQ